MSRAGSVAGYPRVLLDSSGNAIEGETKTATFQSESLDIPAYLFVGLFLKVSSVSGTSPTLDVDVEISPDGGTTWYNMPEDYKSTDQAAMTQLTAAGQEFKTFALPAVEQSSDYQIRFVFTLGGTSPSFDIDQARAVFFGLSN